MSARTLVDREKPGTRAPRFSPASLAFLRALARNNRREWFAPRKQQHEELVRAPMVALVEHLAEAFKEFAPDLVASPRVSLYRVYRDTRFSADKSPLKTHIAAIFPHRLLPKHEGAGLYLEVSAKHVWLGGGMYMPTTSQLHLVREHIAEDYRRLQRIVSSRPFKLSVGTLDGETLQRVPRGFPADHPAVEFLKYRQFLAGAERPAAVRHRPGVLARRGAGVQGHCPAGGLSQRTVARQSGPSQAFARAMVRPRRLAAALGLVAWLIAAAAPGQIRLADETDALAFRAWFTFLVDAQFYHPTPEVTDCAALVRYACRESLRAHGPEWYRQAALPLAPAIPDLRHRPAPGPNGWPLFKIAEGQYAEFADARTIIRLNARLVGRDLKALRPGDLLYYRQDTQDMPDHLMVFIGPSRFEPSAVDWVVYHTGPIDGHPGEVRKTRLADLLRHPIGRWRPTLSNPAFIGVFRLNLL